MHHSTANKGPYGEYTSISDIGRLPSGEDFKVLLTHSSWRLRHLHTQDTTLQKNLWWQTPVRTPPLPPFNSLLRQAWGCLLYTSDAADDC